MQFKWMYTHMHNDILQRIPSCQKFQHTKFDTVISVFGSESNQHVDMRDSNCLWILDS